MYFTYSFVNEYKTKAIYVDSFVGVCMPRTKHVRSYLETLTFTSSSHEISITNNSFFFCNTITLGVYKLFVTAPEIPLHHERETVHDFIGHRRKEITVFSSPWRLQQSKVTGHF